MGGHLLMQDAKIASNICLSFRISIVYSRLDWCLSYPNFSAFL